MSLTLAPVQRRRLVIVVLLVGLALRLWLITVTTGNTFDVESTLLFWESVVHHGLHAYPVVDRGVPRWPYPPGWLAAIAVSIKAGHLFHVTATNALRLPLVVADIALAWLVQAILGWTGRSEVERVIGAALIALGPPALAISVLQGQIDDVSALAILGAIAIWMRMESPIRWLVAGLIIGAGAAIKITPIFAVLALLPTARSSGERVRLAVTALAVPALAVVPFAFASPRTVHDILGYHGAAGAAGLNLLVQPHLAYNWFAGAAVKVGTVDTALGHLATPIALAAVAVAAAYSWRHRLDPLVAGVLIYATLLAFSVNIFFQYSAWLLPLLIASGRLRAAAAASAVLCVPIAFNYGLDLHIHSGPWSDGAILGLYEPAADLLWAGAVAVVITVLWQLRKASPSAEFAGSGA